MCLLEVDKISRTARIEAGAFGQRWKRSSSRTGSRYDTFPQSFEHSTLGGWIATWSGDHFTSLYSGLFVLFEQLSGARARADLRLDSCAWRLPRAYVSDFHKSGVNRLACAADRITACLLPRGRDKAVGGYGKGDVLTSERRYALNRNDEFKRQT